MFHEGLPKNLSIKDQISLLGEQLRPHPWKIAVDGQASAGKGTLTNRLHDVLGLNLCPAGDMYRAATYYLTEVLKLNPDALDDEILASHLADFSISFVPDGYGRQRLFILSESQKTYEDITDRLHDPAIGERVSAVAKRDPVIDKLDGQQLEMFAQGKTVLEGRDKWRTAKEKADFLVYLHARDEVLIKREIDRQAKRGVTLTPEAAAAIVIKRNDDDNARVERGKLLTPDEAQKKNIYDLIIDTSDMTPDEILLTVLQSLAQKVS